MSREKLSRNAPCPCGSGRKYKRCCLEDGRRLKILAVAASLPTLFPLLRPQSAPFEAWVHRVNASRDRSRRPSAALMGEGIGLLDDAEVERILAAPQDLVGDVWRRLHEDFDDEHMLNVALLNGAVASALDEPHSLDLFALELIENDVDLHGDPSELLALVVDARDLWSVKEAGQVEKALQTISDALDVFSDGAYRDRTGDLRLAKPSRGFAAVSVGFHRVRLIRVFMRNWSSTTRRDPNGAEDRLRPFP